MTRYWFVINVEVESSRHMAKKLQELLWENLEESTFTEQVIEWQSSGKLRGLTVQATSVKEIKKGVKP